MKIKGVMVVGKFCKNLRIRHSKLYVGSSPNNSHGGVETGRKDDIVSYKKPQTW